MSDYTHPRQRLAAGSALLPAEPLWRLAPTHAEDGRALADFMMLIPGLATRPAGYRECVAARIRGVCRSYGERVAFADLNCSISVLWVSVAAEPGLSGQVAQAIRQQVPEALLVGGQLGAAAALPEVAGRFRLWRRRVRGLRGRFVGLLGGPGR